MAASKGKDTRDERHASLIPVLEREEQQLRAELEQVRLDAQDQIHQAEEQAAEQVRQSRIGISELVDQKRKEGLADLQSRAEQLSLSAEERCLHLRRQVERNMARAVRKVVDTVAAVGDET